MRRKRHRDGRKQAEELLSEIKEKNEKAEETVRQLPKSTDHLAVLVKRALKGIA